MAVELIFTKIGNFLENELMFMLKIVIAQSWLYCKNFQT